MCVVIMFEFSLELELKLEEKVEFLGFATLPVKLN